MRWNATWYIRGKDVGGKGQKKKYTTDRYLIRKEELYREISYTDILTDILLEKKNYTDAKEMAEDRNVWRTLRRDWHKPVYWADNWRERCCVQFCQRDLLLKHLSKWLRVCKKYGSNNGWCFNGLNSQRKSLPYTFLVNIVQLWEFGLKY